MEIDKPSLQSIAQHSAPSLAIYEGQNTCTTQPSPSFVGNPPKLHLERLSTWNTTSHSLPILRYLLGPDFNIKPRTSRWPLPPWPKFHSDRSMGESMGFSTTSRTSTSLAAPMQQHALWICYRRATPWAHTPCRLQISSIFWGSRLWPTHALLLTVRMGNFPLNQWYMMKIKMVQCSL